MNGVPGPAHDTVGSPLPGSNVNPTGLATTFPILVVFSIIAGLGSGALNPSQQAAIADVIGRERNGGPALAAFQMSADAGAIIGPVLAGALVDSGSFALAFGVTGVLSLVAAVPWTRARETLPREAVEASAPSMRR